MYTHGGLFRILLQHPTRTPLNGLNCYLSRNQTVVDLVAIDRGADFRAVDSFFVQDRLGKCTSCG
jgi:hypothetical protein